MLFTAKSDEKIVATAGIQEIVYVSTGPKFAKGGVRFLIRICLAFKKNQWTVLYAQMISTGTVNGHV